MDLDAVANVLGWTRTVDEEELAFFEPYPIRLHTRRYLEALERGVHQATAEAELLAVFHDKPDLFVRLPGAFLTWRWAAFEAREADTNSLGPLDLTIMNCVTRAPDFTDEEICGLILGLARQPDRALLGKFFPLLRRTSQHRWNYGWSEDLIDAVCELREVMEGERTQKEEKLYVQLCEICKDFEEPPPVAQPNPDSRTVTLHLGDAQRPTSSPTPSWQQNAQQLLQQLGADRTRETIGRGLQAFIDRGTESVSYEILLGYVWLCESLCNWQIREQLSAVATRALTETDPMADDLSDACLELLDDDHANYASLLSGA